MKILPTFFYVAAYLSSASAIAENTLTIGTAHLSTPVKEVRGTWVTTTANSAISTPANTAATMKKLADIGLNTVYVEVWKNGYTQYPSQVLKRTIGVEQRPTQALQDPSDAVSKTPPRDLLQETAIAAHRNGLHYIAWFEYGFMAAHKTTMNHLWKQKPEWLSRDINGSEIAPNGFVWMNPLHPEARVFLLDLVLEAIDKYDIDGIQIDDRIVWPYVTMGYDDTTRKIYAAEHNGTQPPNDHKDPAFMAWRSAKVNEYSKWFTQEIRARRPGLLVSLSPAVYPWSYDYYLLNWPAWSGWQATDRITAAPVRNATAQAQTPRWDEFIPQAYRFNYDAFEKTWREQVAHVDTYDKKHGSNRKADMLAGIRLTGDSIADSSWDQLKRSIDLTRTLGNGGHVLWFSRAVTDVFSEQLKTFYSNSPAVTPRFPTNWRPSPIVLFQAPADARLDVNITQEQLWQAPHIPAGKYQLIGFNGATWEVLSTHDLSGANTLSINQKRLFSVAKQYSQVELLRDRRDDFVTIKR
jgi:uncharacterized lipoprotein YddW (UPF0748 family)